MRQTATNAIGRQHQSWRATESLQAMVSRLAGYNDNRIVSQCTHCDRVAWPVGAALSDCSWINAAQYARRGGHRDVVISHGICPSCHAHERSQAGAIGAHG